MGHYRSLGCQPTYTCAPYQLPFARPALGEQVAWAESNAIVFCNSVLGARTERYGDFTDIACAITGRVPNAGLHRADARRASLVLRLAADVPAALRDDDAFYPVLGIVLGRRAGSRVAALDGLPPGVSEDRLKAVGAAAASRGAVAMFHAVGSTPEPRRWRRPSRIASRRRRSTSRWLSCGPRGTSSAPRRAARPRERGSAPSRSGLRTRHLGSCGPSSASCPGRDRLAASSFWSRRLATCSPRRRRRAWRAACARSAWSCWWTPAATSRQCFAPARCPP